MLLHKVRMSDGKKTSADLKPKQQNRRSASICYSLIRIGRFIFWDSSVIDIHFYVAAYYIIDHVNFSPVFRLYE
jgi:hypothetical protein